MLSLLNAQHLSVYAVSCTALSRIPCRQCGFDPNWENTENLAQHVRNIQEREIQEVDEKEVSISEKQKSDKDLTLIRKWVEKGEKPELKEITGESITVKSMWAQFDQLTIIDDVLVRRLEGLNTKLQVIVPMTERRTSCMFLACCARFSVFSQFGSNPHCLHGMRLSASTFRCCLPGRCTIVIS
jgi:hypothetical protein